LTEKKKVAHLTWRSLSHIGDMESSLGRASEMEMEMMVSEPIGATQQLVESIKAQLPYPCSSDDVYCVVEEWTFF